MCQLSSLENIYVDIILQTESANDQGNVIKKTETRNRQMMRLSVGMKKMACVAAVDLVCILIVAMPCLLLNVIGEPYMRGFFCSDESIRHPYLDSTVPDWVLILISYGLPAIIIALVETALLKHSDTFSGARLAREMYNTFGLFMFGSMVNQLLTDTSKFTIGSGKTQCCKMHEFIVRSIEASLY